MSDRMMKLLLRIGGFLLIAFVFFQVFRNFSSSYETETVYLTTVNEYVEADAIAIRNETLLRSDKKGVAVYTTQNGEKVANGSVLIEYYNSQSDVSVKKQIEELEMQIGVLTDLNVQNSNTIGDLDVISNQIKINLINYLNACDSSDKSELNKSSYNLLKSLNQGKIATGRENNYNKIIKDLKSKLTALNQKYKPPFENYKSSHSGYFVNTADGYESLYDYDNVLELKKSDISGVKKEKIPSDCVGKLINSDEWFFVATIKNNKLRSVIKGKNVTVQIPSSDVGEIDMYVEEINDNNDGTSTAILSCSYMSAELSTLRSQKIQIIAKRHTGLKINKGALRVQNGITGVFVAVGELIKFREIEIVYSADEFVICKLESGANKVKIYDEAIIKGKGLEHEQLL